MDYRKTGRPVSVSTVYIYVSLVVIKTVLMLDSVVVYDDEHSGYGTSFRAEAARTE